MRLAIFGVVAFVLGLGGSTGVLVLTAPAHSHLADSLAVAQAHGDSLAQHPAPAVAQSASVRVPVPVHILADTAASQPASVLPRTPASPAASDGAGSPIVTHVPAPAAAIVHVTLPLNAPDAESFKQVGSILLNMKPVEAAKIVSYLNDDQVEGLLRSMTPRQAAGVLGQLPPERAAALSRRLLVPSAREAKP